jgi:hypothetical protein
MTANEFNAALLAGGTFVYLVGWLPDARKRMDGGDISELHLVAKLAMEAQKRRQACLTQRCLRRGVGGGRFSRQFCNVSWLSLGVLPRDTPAPEAPLPRAAVCDVECVTLSILSP